MDERPRLGFHATVSEWAARVTAPHTEFSTAFNNGDCSIEYWAPRDQDTQKPHDRDEVYVIISGSAHFSMNNELREVKAGDLIFVPAGAPHRFESFSNDLAMWIAFFGERHLGYDRTP
jgi:mannose-6-phosphate isomerase-like protein (cupin superfamily)